MGRTLGVVLLATFVAFVVVPVETVSASSPTAPPGAPTGVTATAGSLAATVTWQPSGPIASTFTVTSNPGGITSTVDGSLASATVSGLGFGLSYSFTVQGVNAVGAGPSSAASNAVNPLAPGGQYQPGIPFVLFSGTVAAGHPLAVSLGADPVTVPGLSAVVVNVTASNATTPSAVQLVVNQQVVDTVAAPVGKVDSNLAFVAIPPSLSQAALSVTAGSVHVELAFVGFITGPGRFRNHGGMLRPIQPAVLFNGAVTAGSSTHIPVLGQGDVPATNVSEVLVNLTASGSAAAGSLGLEPTGLPVWFPPPPANLGFAAGETTANRAIIAVGSDGAIALLDKGAAASVRVEALGWFTSSADPTALGALFSPAGPARLVDSAASGGPVADGSSISFAVRGQGGVPGSNSTAPPTSAMFQVTAVSPQGAGSISFAGSPAIDFAVGQTTSGLVTSTLGNDGSASFSVSGAATNVTVDLVGYFSGDLILPGSTKVLTPALLAAITGIGSDYSVTFAPGTQVSPFIQLNDVIVAGVSPTTPTGFLLRVLSITTLSSGAVVLGTRIARLPEALTAFTLDWSLPPTAGLFGAVRTSTGPSAAPAQSALPLSSSNPFPPPVGTSIDPKYPAFAIASPGHSIQFFPAPWAQLGVDDLEVQALPHYRFEYNFFTNQVKAAFAFSVGVRIALSDTITKDFTAVALELYHHQFFIGNSPRVTLLGDVPVVYWPEVTVTLNFDATVSVGLSTSYHLDKWAQATVSFDGSQWHAGEAVHEYANGFDQPEVVADASAKLSLHVIPGIQFYLVLTGGVDISPYISATVMPTKSPWWQLAAGICIGVAEDLNLIFYKASYSQAFACDEFVLLHAPGLKLNVVVAPSPATVPRFKTQHFQAGVPNSSHGVIWSVVGGNASGTLSNSTVTDTDYTAPGVPGAYKVRAAAIDDPSSFADVAITVPAGAPTPPIAVTAVAGATSALASWSPPSDSGGVPITAYHVAVSPGGAQVDTGNVLSVTVPNLTPGSTYTFTVTATNNAGLTSAPSAPSPPVTIPSSAAVSVTPAFIDFGTLQLGQTSPPQTVTVSASSAAPLHITQIFPNGNGGQDFTIQNDFCSGQTVAAGGACTFAVTYAGKIQGLSKAQIQIFDDATGSPHSMTVQGQVPLPMSTGFDQVLDRQFLDLQRGWVSDATGLLATTDGGQTWTRQLPPSGITLQGNFRFIDALHGWALGNSPASPTCTANCVAILGTSNGGATWTQLSIIPSLLQPTGIWFFDATHGWVIGNAFLADGTFRAAMYATTDGGVTWTLQSLPDPVLGTCTGTFRLTESVSLVRSFDANQAWAVGSAECTDFPNQLPTNASTFVWSTGDGGTTWVAHNTGLNVFAFPVRSRLQVLSATQIRFATQAPGAVMVSSDDGGATFNQVRLPDTVGDLEFIDTNNVVMLAPLEGDAWTSSDGGTTWVLSQGFLPNNILATNISQAVYTFLEPVDTTHWWVMGRDQYVATDTVFVGGLIEVTTDGGANYLTQLVGTGTPH